jgi:Uma2 family endonuclease
MRDAIIISTRAIGGLNDDEFFRFCSDNRELTFERDADGQIILMPNTGGKTGRLNSEINFQLVSWNRANKRGVTFDSSTTFRLPNTAMRSPDAAWISADRWNRLTAREQEQFPPLCPDFVIELRSRTDSMPNLQKKMQEWMENGCRLGWLIDTKGQASYVYRLGKNPEKVNSFDVVLSGEEVLPGFELHLQELK